MAEATTQVAASERQGGRFDVRVVMAFLAIYVLWGTTFLAIRIAVREVPPLFAAGSRMLLAGAVLFGWMRLRGAGAANEGTVAQPCDHRHTDVLRGLWTAVLG